MYERFNKGNVAEELEDVYYEVEPRTSIDIPQFIQEKAHRDAMMARLRKITEQEEKKKESCKVIETHKSINPIAEKVILIFALIGLISTIRFGAGAVIGKINSLPKTVEAPAGYEKIVDTIRVKSGDTLDGIVAELMTDYHLSSLYRFQDLKEEIIDLNPTITDINFIKAGDYIRYPSFEKEGESVNE